MSRRWIVVLAVAGCDGGSPSGSVDAPAFDAPEIDAMVDAPVADLCRAVEVSAGGGHTCARTASGDLWCWGRNGLGQVGSSVQMSCAGGTACNPTAELVSLPPVTALGLGEQHTCAVTGATTHCWGRNEQHQFGNNSVVSASSPTLVTERAGATSIVGGDRHSCSLHAGGFVRCSGENLLGQVGDGSQTARTTPVTTVNGGASAIGSGLEHACAVSGGFVQCWGSNAQKQIDQGAALALTARTVTGFANATDVSAGTAHTCALLTAGDVRCWGANNLGQLGIGNTTAQTTVVTPTVSGIVELAAGGGQTCARASGGDVFCWGESFTPTPTVVTLSGPAVSIAVGGSHACFALADGSVWCRGSNAHGQRGNGTSTGAITDPPTRAVLCP